MVHVCPEADSVGECSPHALVLPHGFLALLDERLDAVFFNIFLVLETELLLDFDLDRKAVCVPSCLSRNALTLHGVVSRDRVLDDTRQDMTDVRLAICRRRAVIEHVERVSFIFLDALLEDFIVIPELDRFFLAVNEIHVGVNLFIKHLFPLLQLSRRC